jgi:NAD(P)-dependent dehydrogenase (short-subunit alcohol dehydrogenase family)
MAGQVDGKVVLVTGGASGIGRAAALAFVQEGATVVIADLDVQGGEATVCQLQEQHGKACFVRTDVSKAAEVEALVHEAVTRYGRLDCAFNSAGILGSRFAVADTTEEEWAQILGINLTGVWLCMKYEICQMLTQMHGAIVNASSVMGLVGSVRAAYTASKHGVVGLTKSAALAYAKAGIRVNAVCPGYIHSPMTEAAFSRNREQRELTIARHPVGRLGTPEEVAAAVVWLCSEAASFVTGHMLTVDGGYVAQ